MRIPTPDDVRDRIDTGGSRLLVRCVSALSALSALDRRVTVPLEGETPEGVRVAMFALARKGWRARVRSDSLEIAPMGRSL